MENRKYYFGIFNFFQTRPFDKDFDLQKKVLARGDYSEIRQCVDKRSGEIRTCKMYRISDINERIVEMIKKEISILATLDHPCITKVHAVYQDASRIYVLIDTIKGQSLYERIIKNGQIQESEAASITQRLLSALKYLHGQGYAHRNLRPETILFETDMSIYDLKIVEFLSIGQVSKSTGIPTMISDEECDDLESLLNQVHSYTKSPELLKIKERDFGTKTDLWTIGVILYNMITGIPPFYESTDFATRDKIKQASYSCQYPNYVQNNANSELKDLVSKLIIVDSHNRLSAAQALEHPWINKHVNFQLPTKKQANDALQSMKNIFFTHQLQRQVLLSILKTQLDRKEKEGLCQLFEALDENKDSYIQVSDVIKHYKDKFSITVTEADFDKSEKHLLLSRAGGITFTEFLIGACSKPTIITESSVKQVFQYIDGNGNMQISKDELKAFIGIDNDEMISNMLVEADVDSSGYLDYKEFCNLMYRLNRII